MTKPFNTVYLKRFSIFIFLISIATLALYLHTQNLLTPEVFLNYTSEQPFKAPSFFILIYFVMTIGFIPTLPMNLAAGVLWGPIYGSALTLIGAVLGSSFSFLVSRFLLSETIESKFQKRTWLWLKNEINSKPLRVIAFMRLNPIFPFGPTNYFFGITGISFKIFFLATLVFSIPSVLFVSVLGHLSGSIVLGINEETILNNVLMLSVAITLVIALRYYSKIHGFNLERSKLNLK